ncbi:MAG: CBS domain-containing protein [Spirochaetes bacterium]|jgi:CBS domain-containing protein|nr:CBS domain-containing protein [Spirochaetota bacterium]
METVREILQHKGSDVWSIQPQATTQEALERMREKNAGALLVIDAQGALQGIFSERNFASHVTENRVRHLPVFEHYIAGSM